ncbi:MAG: putative quinol monooxygenase [Methanobrevibacter sp.]|uniref:putative quinol monooxygenase n=1 Tax=Methanobrevibacter sp. TaxID=66852 RepID=UPI003EFDE18E
MDFIVVLAKIQPKEGCLDSILELSEELIYESLLEEGNIDYQLLKSDKEDILIFVEKWESLEHLKKHMASPHFLDFNSESEEFIKSNDVQILKSTEIEF